MRDGEEEGVVGAGVAGLLLCSFNALGVVSARGIGLRVAESAVWMTMVDEAR